jgi:inner membrane protein
MTSRTHDLAAFTALGLIVLVEPVRVVTLSTALLALLANQMGGIAPDIDQPTAPLWRNLPVGHIFGKVTDKMLGGHRFLTHSILGLALFGGLARLLLNFLSPLMPHTNTGLVWWAFIIGMISHLVMDTLTKEGVPWLLPVPVKFGFPPIKKLRVTTGHWAENFVVFPALLLINVVVASQTYPRLERIVHAIHG